MKVELITMAILATIFVGCTKSDNPANPPSTSNTVDSLTIGLIASYLFNGNANDESGNKYNGTVKDAILTTDRFGSPGKAYNFNDSSSYIVLPKLVKADSLKEFTISVWVKPILTNPNDDVYLSFMGSDSTLPCTNRFGFANGNGGYLTYNGFITTIKPFVCSNTLANDYFPNPSGGWYHLVFTEQLINPSSYSPYFRYNQYLNGIKSAKSSGSGMNPIYTSFSSGGCIGANYFANYAFSYFAGSIDDVRIYNRVLSDKEILQLYNLK